MPILLYSSLFYIIIVKLYAHFSLFQRSSSPRTSLTTRPPIPCPMCDKLVVWVRRHLRNVHHASDRKTKNWSQNKDDRHRWRKGAKDHRPRKECPFAGCNLKVTRLDKHLSKFHQLSHGVAKEMIQRSRPVAKNTTAKQARRFKCMYNNNLCNVRDAVACFSPTSIV